MTMYEEIEVTVNSEALHKSIAAALREMADKLDPPNTGYVSNVAVSGGVCLTHGSYTGPRCPSCSTA